MNNITPKLFRLLLEVSDLKAAITFYCALLGTEGRMIRGGRYYFDCGQVILGLVDVSSAQREPRALSEYIYFATSSLEEVYQRAAGLNCLSGEEIHGQAAGEIKVRPWGERSFYVEDVNGNRLCFVDEQTLFTGA